MTFTGILHDIEDIINWTKQQDFADPDKIILSGQSMGGYAAATAAPIVNPHALILMCPGAGMWFGCKDRAEAMEAQGIMKADIEGLCFPTSLIMIYISTSHFLPQKDIPVLFFSSEEPQMTW